MTGEEAPRLRIVLVSQYVTALRGMAQVCRRQGHEPVLAVCARMSSPHARKLSGEMLSQAKALVGASPPGLSVVVMDDVDALCDLIERYTPDALIVRGFPWRLPDRALSAPGYGAVNLHPSRLPALRGPFPVHWAIRNGDTTLAVTAHRMDAGFDTGPVLAAASFPVDPDEFGPAIWRRVDLAAKQALDSALARLMAGDPGEVQRADLASYAGDFSADDEILDWTRTAAEVHNLVRAWSLGSLRAEGPVTELDGVRVRVLRTCLTPADGPRRDCADGPIWLTEYHPADDR